MHDQAPMSLGWDLGDLSLGFHLCFTSTGYEHSRTQNPYPYADSLTHFVTTTQCQSCSDKTLNPESYILTSPSINARRMITYVAMRRPHLLRDTLDVLSRRSATLQTLLREECRLAQHIVHVQILAGLGFIAWLAD